MPEGLLLLLMVMVLVLNKTDLLGPFRESMNTHPMK
jgi:hypothetical protein